MKLSTRLLPRVVMFVTSGRSFSIGSGRAPEVTGSPWLVSIMSQERRLSGLSPKMIRRSAVKSRSVSQPQVDETEIMGDRVEITGDHRVLFLLAQTCCGGPLDVHTARDRLERIKWRQTVPCSAQVLKQSSNSHSAHPPHTACSQTYLRAIRELLDGKVKYPRPNFYPRLRF